MSEFIKKALADIKVKVSEEFDRNFERKAFFDEKWKPTRRANHVGSLMMRTGKLRRSLRASTQGTSINFSSSMSYASIHNEGGEIKITPKMRRYFWAMYYKNMQGVSMSITSHKTTSKRAEIKNTTAEYYKGMAMHRGDTITMPKRQFIGHHSSIDKMVESVLERRMSDMTRQLFENLKNY